MRPQDVALDVALEFFIAATRVSAEMNMLGCRERHEGIDYKNCDMSHVPTVLRIFKNRN